MNLNELLSELRENVLHDRSDRTEGSSDYLWSDATLIRYIAESERRFARKGLVLRDNTSKDATYVTLKAGQAEYVLHPSVIAVLSARNADDNTDMKRGGHSALSMNQQVDDGAFDVNQLSVLLPGKPRAFSTDEGLGPDDNDSTSAVTMRLYPVPSAEWDTKIVRLRVVRTPLEPLKNLTQIPEIGEDHHLEMLDWAAYLALRIVDHDAGDVARAAEFRASFEDHVKEARRNAMRKMFAPQSWGFGRNGWAWGN